MFHLKATRARLRRNGFFDHILHILAVGRYRTPFSELRYLFLASKVRARLFNGISLVLPKSRAGIGKELLLYGIHEPTLTALYEELIEPGERIFELGANIGYYVAVADAKLRSEVEFLAVEPDPDVFGTLKTNVEAMDAHIRLFELAVSDSTGEVAFFRSSSSNLGSIRRNSWTDDHSVKVPSTTVDALCEEHAFKPTVLRMDIEGAEIFALRGAKRVLSTCKPKLFIELHPPLMGEAELRETLAILQSSGYTSFDIVDRSYDQPYSLKWLPRAKARRVTIDELELMLRRRHISAIGMIGRHDSGDLPN